jgi:DNA-binding transcriptional LysR family regulator
MQAMNEFLPTTPFDLYELHLFHLVALHRSFTKAAGVAGLTQSAVTRQVQGVEAALGIELFERTTRSVQLTAAGRALWREATRLIGDIDHTLRNLREEFTDAKKEIRVGVSRSVGLAYLPGFFHANLRRLPHVGYRLSYSPSAEILSDIEANEIDVGVLCPPRRLPRTVQNWLLLDDRANTGRRLRAWMAREGCTVEPGMLLPGFDLIINLVALGMGVSFVPARALALYAGKRKLRRLRWPDRFERELVVVIRRHRKVPPHLTQFIENVLF